MLCFTCREKKICKSIKKSQNIMTMIADVVNYFLEVNIPFGSLSIEIFLVKITCIKIFLKAYFLKLKKKNRHI